MSASLAALRAVDLVAWLRLASERLTAHADELTELDAAIGDADHGANMRRGFEALVVALDEKAPATPSAVLKTAAMTIISKVGGASGPLYGTLLLRASTAVGDAEDMGEELLGEALHAGVAGVQQRGKAVAGEKTMLDAWIPALDALDAHRGDLAAAVRAAAEAAAQGRDATAPLQATKGRASYIAERSVGHIDPGAASTAIILGALADTIDGTGAAA